MPGELREKPPASTSAYAVSGAQLPPAPPPPCGSCWAGRIITAKTSVYCSFLIRKVPRHVIGNLENAEKYKEENDSLWLPPP